MLLTAANKAKSSIRAKRPMSDSLQASLRQSLSASAVWLNNCNSSAMLNCYLQKSIKNRLRRWDFCTPVSLSDGQRSKCADLAELLQIVTKKKKGQCKLALFLV